MDKKTRDYKAEYARRIERGAAQGVSRSTARGHPKPTETSKRASSKPLKVKDWRRLEEALQAMKGGETLTRSANAFHIAPERLRKYLAQSTIVSRRGRSWTFAPDSRRRIMPFYSKGQEIEVTVDLATAVWIGRYIDHVGKFISSGDDNFLWPFEGGEIIDVSGQHHLYETDPNELYRLTASGDSETFEDIYRIIP